MQRETLSAILNGAEPHLHETSVCSLGQTTWRTHTLDWKISPSGVQAVRISAPIAYILLYAALYAAFGVASPFWPRFFETRALSPQQIGFMLAAGMLMRLAAGPLVGMFADRAGSLRLALALCTALAAASAAALFWAHSFSLLLFITVIQAACLAPTTSLPDALSVNAARPRLAGREFEYGWIRGSASLAFILGTLTIGQLISRTDVTPIIWMNASLLVAAAGSTGLLPAVVAGSSPHRGGSSVIGELGGLLRISRFRMMILVSSSIYGSHAMYDGFAVIWWSAAGIAPSAISALWSEAVAAEVVVFFLIGPALLHRFGARSAAALAAVAGTVRWSVAGVTTSVLTLSILQLLHGLTFALLHLASMRMMRTLVPAGLAGTGQSIYAFGSGCLTAVLTFLSGILYARFGGAAFLPMAVLCAVALPLAWLGFGDERNS
jgi:MFS transporter, PPP family, 3-phenylpropionic acid transporter